MESGSPHSVGFANWREVQDTLAGAYFPHAMEPLSSQDAWHVSIDTVDLGACRVTNMSLGTSVRIRTDHPGAYAVNIPLTGRLSSVIDGSPVENGIGDAAICPPDTPTLIPAWKPSCTLLGFKIDRRFLEREHERTLGRQHKPLPLTIDLHTPGGRAWLSMLRSVSDYVQRNRSTIASDPRLLTQMSSMLVTGMLLALTPEERNERSGTRPRVVQRVIDAIEADPARPWSPGELAEFAGVSVRRLQQAFREYCGLTPFQYLREVRVERAHGDLLNAPEGLTVTDIAMRWGLTHTGRFAADYRHRYGQNPSETLAR